MHGLNRCLRGALHAAVSCAVRAPARSAQQQGAAEPEKPWWKHSRLMIVIAGYGSVVFLFNFMDELVPLFASAPRSSVGSLSP